MAKKKKKPNRMRMYQVAGFGKDLVRRSKSTCEVCSTKDSPLKPREVHPLPEEPHPDQCVFVCDDCHDGLERPERIQPERWRFLVNSVWSETPAVQVESIRMLRRLAGTQNWAQDTLDQVYVEPHVEDWVENHD